MNKALSSKSAAQIRQDFGIRDDLTAEEKKAVLNEPLFTPPTVSAAPDYSNQLNHPPTSLARSLSSQLGGDDDQLAMDLLCRFEAGELLHG